MLSSYVGSHSLSLFLLNAHTIQNQPSRDFLPDIMQLPGIPHTTRNGPDLDEQEESTDAELLTPMLLLKHLRLLIPNTYDYFSDKNVHEALAIRLIVLVRLGMRYKVR